MLTRKVCWVGTTVELIGSTAATTNIRAVKLRKSVTIIPNLVSKCFGEMLKTSKASKTLRIIGNSSVST